MSPEKELERAARAKALIENELLKEAFTLMRENLIASWETSKAMDQDAREKAWQMMKVVNEVERHLHNVLQTGMVAEKMIEDRKKQEMLSKISKRGFA